MTKRPIRITATLTLRDREAEHASPVLRQWRLLVQLAANPRGLTVQQIANMTGTARQMARRDLIVLREVGFDIREKVGPYGLKTWRCWHVEKR